MPITVEQSKRWLWRTLTRFRLESAALVVQRQTWKLAHYLPAQWAYLRGKAWLAPDGLPLPPPKLIFLVTGTYDRHYFYQNGMQGAHSIRAALDQQGLRLDNFQSILDFGCGCGRIMRHWQTMTGPRFHGTDYNSDLIEWCWRTLAFAHFKINRLAVPLAYETGQFDFIYTISVFTHLSEKLQRFWMGELGRILRPGGYLLITTHGRSRFFQLTPAEIQMFESGRLVIRQPHRSGTNFCSAYHPEQYIRSDLARDFEVMAFVPQGAQDANQDLYLLRKPSV